MLEPQVKFILLQDEKPTRRAGAEQPAPDTFCVVAGCRYAGMMQSSAMGAHSVSRASPACTSH